MNKGSVLFLSLAPHHASARRRLNDCASGDFTISAPNFGVNRVDKSIFRRLCDGDYLRVFKMAATAKSTVVWAWGHDVCFVASIAMAFSRRRRLIWDISDINHRLLGKTPLSRFLSILESLLIKRADILFLTSQAFYENHYKRIIPERKFTVIENKKNEAGEADAQIVNSPKTDPLVVIFTGIFRSNSMFEIISKVANSLGSGVNFHLHGVCDKSTDARLLRELCEHSAHKNVFYFGKFDNTDLPQIYSRGHVTWGFVDETANLNEKWLLTNRIYDAIAYKKPILTNKGTYSGFVVKSRAIGLSVDYDHVSIARAIKKLIENDAKFYNDLVAAMPNHKEAYLCGAYKDVVENLIHSY